MKSLLSQRKAVADGVVRDAICDAVRSLLLRAGLAGLTMDGLAEAVGVSKGTLYNYFENKEELLVAVYSRLSDSLEEEVDALFADREASVERSLERIVTTIWKYVDRDRSTLFILHHCKAVTEKRAQRERDFLNNLTAMIQRGIDQGELPAQEAGISAWLVFGALLHACRQPYESPDLCPPMAVIPEGLTAFVLRAVGAGKARREPRSRKGKDI